MGSSEGARGAAFPRLAALPRFCARGGSSQAHSQGQKTPTKAPSMASHPSQFYFPPSIAPPPPRRTTTTFPAASRHHRGDDQGRNINEALLLGHLLPSPTSTTPFHRRTRAFATHAASAYPQHPIKTTHIIEPHQQQHTTSS